MAKVGRPSKFEDPVWPHTGVTVVQNIWMTKLAKKLGVSKMALYRTAMSMLMKLAGEPISDALKKEKKDVLEQIKKM
ncbi:hypothetical protein ES705_20554 [subsurface metagenome]